jgi:hypothetical protein
MSYRLWTMRVSEEPVYIYLFRQNPVFYLPAFEISLSCRTASVSYGEKPSPGQQGLYSVEVSLPDITKSLKPYGWLIHFHKIL